MVEWESGRWMVTLVVIMRGTSGAGKTTWARHHYPDALHLCSDDYVSGAFSPKKFKVAHEDMLWDLRGAMQDFPPVVVIDKCNIRLTAMEPYLKVARIRDAPVRVVTILADPLTAFQRATHGASARAVADMAALLESEGAKLPSWVVHDVVRIS